MKYWLIPLVVLCCAALVNPPESDGCGPFLPSVQFDIEHQPGPEFARGQLGIVKPGYFRKYLVVAYRQLTGAPLSAEEIEVIYPAPRKAVMQTSPPRFWGSDGVVKWLEARSRVPGASPMQSVDTYRYALSGGDYYGYQNCRDDAFETAAATLANRSAKWGAASAQIAEWLKAQDEVFSNCHAEPVYPISDAARVEKNRAHIPAALPVGADPLAAADRQYQIAAAHFYAAQFKDAEAGFREVAANTASPWREYGDYLAARALIRQGTVDGEKDALVAAQKELRRILNDPAQKRWHDSALGLSEYLQAQIDPAGRLAEAAAILSKPEAGPRFEKALTDFTMIYDSMEEKAMKRPITANALIDWIAAFQSGDGQRALERWHSGHSTEWLIAALAPAHGKDAAAAELIEAARRTPAGSPAYATAAFHGIRLELEQRRTDEARAWADEALKAKLPLGASNAFQIQRRQMARSWNEFLRYAPMRPAAVDYLYEENPSGSDPAKSRPTIDAETAVTLDEATPLSLWAGAMKNPLLPKRLQAEFAQAGWVRATILSRTADARRFAARTAELRPELAEGMRAYQAAPSAEAAQFEAAFLILRTPGLAPVIQDGLGRSTPVAKLDNFRDNWWDLREDGAMASMRFSDRPPTSIKPETGFLTEAQRAEGSKQWEALKNAAGDAPAYLCAETLRWAKTHPDDPRIPEALHLAVRATRYGQGYNSSSGYSRKAFELLHRRFPKSKWAEMTKYWY